MAVTKYNYSVSASTANNKVASGALSAEIGNSSIVHAVCHIDVNGDDLDVWMKDSLSAGDQTTLTQLVNAHTGEAIEPEPLVVQILEEKTKTGGHYQASGYEIDVSTGDSSKSIDITFPFPISLLSARWTNKALLDGDSVEYLVAPDTTVGAITENVAVSDTIIKVQPSVISNLKLGKVVSITDGTNTDNLGRVVNINTADNEITVETAATNVFLSATPAYVTTTTEILRKMKLCGEGRVELGEAKIGGSCIPANVTMRAIYHNDTSSAKKFRFIIEYLY